MIKINKMLVPKNKYSIKCPYPMTPQYVVIHNTANKASAKSEISYMIRNNNQTSFHYAVDENEIWQGIEENRNAWHSGDGGRGKGNRTGISIEIARSTHTDINKFLKAEENAAMLTAWILQRYGWGIDRVKQHYDFSKKNCPNKTRELGWERFLGMVQKNLTGDTKSIGTKVPVEGKCIVRALNIRPTYDTTQKPIGQFRLNNVFPITGIAKNGWYQVRYNNSIGYVSNKYVTVTKYAEEYQGEKKDSPPSKFTVGQVQGRKSNKFTREGLEIIETTPDNIKIVPLYGKTLKQSGYSGINGGLFDTPNPSNPASNWCISINDGKVIGSNSHTNHWKGQIVRATLAYFKNGKVFNQYRNSISEYSEMPIWAIGGACGLIPVYDTKLEAVPSDVLRSTDHTAIAYKQGKIYLITTQSGKPCTMIAFRGRIQRALSPDSAIALDGGGSTQMVYKGKTYNNNMRRLCVGVVLKEV